MNRAVFDNLTVFFCRTGAGGADQEGQGVMFGLLIVLSGEICGNPGVRPGERGEGGCDRDRRKERERV